MVSSLDLSRRIQQIRDSISFYRDELDMMSPDDKLSAMSELNSIMNAAKVARTPVVQEAWSEGKPLTVHAWCYKLEDATLINLDIALTSNKMVEKALKNAVQKVFAKFCK